MAEQSQNPSRSTHTKTHTRARSGGAKPKPEPKHTHPHCAPVPAVSGCKPSTHTSTHTPQQPSRQWRGAVETRAEAQTPTPRTRARIGRVQEERAHQHTHNPTPQPGVARAAETRAEAHTPTPHTRARSGWLQAERSHEHTHTPTPQPGVAGRSQNPSPSTHTHNAHPSQERRSRNLSPNTHTHTAHLCQEWRGASGAHTQPDTNPDTPARGGGAQLEPKPNHTHPHRTPQPGVAGYKRSAHTSAHTPQHPSQERGRNPNPTTTQTQTQAPPNSRKPSVHSPGTQAARAMQVTRPNEIWRPGVRLYPKACAALGLEAERATPKHLRIPVPRTCMHARGTGYARKSVEPLEFRPREGTCASTGAQPPGMTSSHAGGDQPSWCCPGPLCWGPPVRSSRKSAASPVHARNLFLLVTGVTPGGNMGRLSTTECTYLPTYLGRRAGPHPRAPRSPRCRRLAAWYR